MFINTLIKVKIAQKCLYDEMLQAVYSRVARVCKNDNGGPHKHKTKWTSFLKARLNCSMPGAYPFYFDQVQAMSQVVSSKTDDKLIFGIFNTPENSITGSAVCSFRLSDIADSFDGPFKGQADANSNWLPLARHEEPRTRPGQCQNNSRQLGDEYLTFIKENALMDEAVTSSTQTPHYIQTSPHERLTTIAVDPAVGLASPASGPADVLFVGTTRGRVLKMASYTDEAGLPATSLIEEMQVFPLHVPVNNILLVRGAAGQLARLVVLSDHEVKSVPVERCGLQTEAGCGGCVGAGDPYCAWNIQRAQCEAHHGSGVDASSLLQNIGARFHRGCGAPASYAGKQRYNTFQCFSPGSSPPEVLLTAPQHCRCNGSSHVT